MREDIIREAIKAAPPALIAGLTLNDWVAIATVVYIIVQVWVLLRRERRRDKRDAAAKPPMDTDRADL